MGWQGLMATETVHQAATLADHLPILQVLVPFLAAPIVVVLGRRALAWPIAVASSLICTVIAFLLLMQVMDGSFISDSKPGMQPFKIESRYWRRQGRQQRRRTN